jgi:D-3-phosphoglycerate dehydrogenase
MKILANDGISQSGIEALKAKGFDVITNNVPQDKLINYINENKIAAILVRSATQVRMDIIDSCPSIKLIGRGGVGMDNIDVAYAREKGLEVINTPASSSQSVAELVMAHMFSISRFTFDSYKEMPSQGDSEFKILKKKYAKGVELRGKTIGIIGFGRIGQNLAKYALGCGMNVLAYDKFEFNPTIKLDFANGASINIDVKKASFEELLANSDYVSLHVPMQEDGSAVINTKEIELMKDGARIVNAARGGVIDEDALVAALESGKIAYAALDVYENEPTPRKDLLANSKIANTPHIGAATNEAQDRIGLELAEKIIAFFKK